MKFRAKVYEPMYDFNNKKYIRLTIPQKASEIIRGMHTSRMHFLTNQIIDDPLDGDVLTVKVPLGMKLKLWWTSRGFGMWEITRASLGYSRVPRWEPLWSDWGHWGGQWF